MKVFCWQQLVTMSMSMLRTVIMDYAYKGLSTYSIVYQIN